MSFRSAYFLLGLVLSLTGLSILGVIVVPRDLTGHFVRFHAGIGLDHNFVPTARDIRAILDANADGRQSVTVIVGGTSVFQGTSQSAPQIWTQRLQQLLGPSYRVINFAQRAGRPNDSGNVAAEMLIQANKPMIFVCDAMMSQFTIPIEAAFYKKTVFDAWERDMLLPWPARDQVMRSALWADDTGFRSAAWEALFNKALNFDDLWTYVDFELVGTQWDKLRGIASIEPLRKATDSEPAPQWYAQRGYPTGDDDLRELQNVKRSIFADPAGSWKAVRKGVEEQMPTALRAQSLVVIDLNSPHYLNRLSETEHAAYGAQAEAMAALLKEMGFAETMIAAGDFTESDYSDRVHLSVAGGGKLAERVAPAVVEMARRRSYVP